MKGDTVFCLVGDYAISENFIIISDFSCLFHSVSFCKWGGIFLRMPPLGVFTFCSSGEERSALR